MDVITARQKAKQYESDGSTEYQNQPSGTNTPRQSDEQNILTTNELVQQ